MNQMIEATLEGALLPVTRTALLRDLNSPKWSKNWWPPGRPNRVSAATRARTPSLLSQKGAPSMGVATPCSLFLGLSGRIGAALLRRVCISLLLCRQTMFEASLLGSGVQRRVWPGAMVATLNALRRSALTGVTVQEPVCTREVSNIAVSGCLQTRRGLQTCIFDARQTKHPLGTILCLLDTRGAPRRGGTLRDKGTIRVLALSANCSEHPRIGCVHTA